VAIGSGGRRARVFGPAGRVAFPRRPATLTATRFGTSSPLDRQLSLRGAMLWLLRWPVVHGVITVAYYLVIVLCHPWIADFSVWLFGSWTKVTVEARAKYDATMTSVGALLLVIYLAVIAKAVWRPPDRLVKAGWLLLTTALAITAFCTLVIMSVEVVHFPQYTLLALLLFPWIRSYGATVCVAALLGMADEAYQYWCLPHDASVYYYDFNDVVLDTLGAAFGVVLLRVCAPGLVVRRSGSVVGLVIAVGAVCVIAMRAFGVLHFNPEPGAEPWILLNERPRPDAFWTTGKPAVEFHLLQPVAGMVTVAVLLMLYSRLGDATGGRGVSAP
jgi:hypothetical protein